jgi:HlyD family type I secretion membrane fusion protein
MTNNAENAIVPTSVSTEVQPSALKRMLAQIDFLAFWIDPPVTSAGQTVASPEQSSRAAIRMGMWSIIVLFGICGIWAAVAPLDSAAIAPGKVVLNNNRKSIQHLEGGIVNKLMVREGQVVKKGDILIRLDETAAKARYELVRKQFVTLRAAEARLIAERDNKKEVTFPEDLIVKVKSDATVRESLDSQKRLFEAHRGSVEGKISILMQKIEQFKEDIQGLRSQTASANRQIQLLNQEISAVRSLVVNGNAPKSRLLALERQQADLSGQLGEYRSRISRSEQSIGEAKIEIINVKNTFLNQVIQELKETQVNLSDTEERVRANEDMFKRINILAPIGGTVTALKVHTVGGVIKPGDTLMDIVPSDDKLIVEARVLPQDIDVVHAGLKANVRLSAYKSRTVPPIEGVVMMVSPDRFDDPNQGVSYYEARIEVDKKELDELNQMSNVQLYPGMPADTLIVTGSRTLLSYLFEPIRSSFSKSFREE